MSRAAHIVSYELFVGCVPEGKELHHTCWNKKCVNPDHCVPLTRDEHRALGSPYEWMRRSRKTCKHGHPYGDNPRIVKGGRVCATCSQIASRRHYERRLSLQRSHP